VTVGGNKDESVRGRGVASAVGVLLLLVDFRTVYFGRRTRGEVDSESCRSWLSGGGGGGMSGRIGRSLSLLWTSAESECSLLAAKERDGIKSGAASRCDIDGWNAPGSEGLSAGMMSAIERCSIKGGLRTSQQAIHCFVVG
jgi:hypothetical protein